MITNTHSVGVVNSGAALPTHVVDLKMLPNDSLDPVFRATVEATEEAIVNAMVAAQDMTGADDHRVIALPHAALRAVLKKYGRLGAGSSPYDRN
jgi:D-aminopeptidase